MGRKGSLQTALVHLLQEGSIALPVVLLTEYKRVGLSEQEVMLLIHIMLFQEKEQKPFPTVSELEERMSCSSDQIVSSLQQLVRGGFLQIEEEVNEYGVRSERFSTSPLLQQLVASFVNREETDKTVDEEAYSSIFRLFEQEFGRALSPMECELLAQWMDEDGYPVELIEAALREAVFCGKVNIRYIDRILLEWQRNKIQTPEEAIDYSRKFRQKGLLYQTAAKENKPTSTRFSFYNWVNQE
ncbi:DnaD domain protein [Paenactinomyces guangxiensis]|uniref:DnaD domain protein n=1 Tax=Paenactinomyces guangxiensis TaxID=1490290 RepID=A0A7W1WR66_9BACL|nr:DnaD domain protein [Paenactinomyces guangxiensis]MBA4494452.1 DnaD domain protein [Paenactinomyces guangxiensis]MBH8591493.1 DnaD domain protein [Paenactinomyces guangxiensis]